MISVTGKREDKFGTLPGYGYNPYIPAGCPYDLPDDRKTKPGTPVFGSFSPGLEDLKDTFMEQGIDTRPVIPDVKLPHRILLLRTDPDDPVRSVHVNDRVTDEILKDLDYLCLLGEK